MLKTVFPTKIQDIRIKKTVGGSDPARVVESMTAHHFSRCVVLTVDGCVSPPDCEQLDHRTSSSHYLRAQLSIVPNTTC